jgi:hypothetical protein
MHVVTDLENPFSGKQKSMREIADEGNRTHLRLLLGICKTTQQTLLALERSAPGTSLPPLWQGKLEAARRDYIEFARQLGTPKDDAEAELARELGEATPGSSDADA